MDIDKAFKEWLEGKTPGTSYTRKGYADLMNINLKDLEWAFYAGYVAKTMGEINERI
jgi:hypothetical protein